MDLEVVYRYTSYSYNTYRNSILSTGEMPEDFREAILIPLLQKTFLDHEILTISDLFPIWPIYLNSLRSALFFRLEIILLNTVSMILINQHMNSITAWKQLC